MYRRKQIVFKQEGDLNYSKNDRLYFLRTLLDEPVGRYYYFVKQNNELIYVQVEKLFLKKDGSEKTIITL